MTSQPAFGPTPPPDRVAPGSPAAPTPPLVDRGKMGRNVAVVFSGTAFMSALGLVTTFLLVRHLAPAEYGILSVVDMVVGVSAGLLATGINWSLVRTIAANRDDHAKVSYVARRVLEFEVAYGLVLSLGLLVGAEFFSGRVLHHPELAFYVRLCSIGVIGSILFEYRRAVLQAFKQFRLDATFGLIQSAAYLAIVLVLLITGLLHIRLLSVAYVTLPLLISLVAVGLMWRRWLGGGYGSSRATFFRQMAPSYGRLLCYTICLWIMNQVHMLTLTRYFTLRDVGIYGFAAKIYVMALMVMSAVKVVTLPTFAEFTDRAALRQAYNRALRGTALASILWWACVPFTGVLVHLFAGGRYAGATAIIQVFMVGAAISTMLSPASQVMIATEKFGVLASAGVIGVVLNVAGHLMVTSRIGGLAAAGVQVTTHVFLNATFAIAAHRELRPAQEKT